MHNINIYVKSCDGPVRRVQTHFSGGRKRQQPLEDVALLIGAIMRAWKVRLKDIPVYCLALHAVVEGVEGDELDVGLPLSELPGGLSADNPLILRKVLCERLDELQTKLGPTPGGRRMRLLIDRDRLLESSIACLDRLDGSMLAGTKLSVTYLGEPAADYGGPKREWYSTVAREIFNPDRGLFVETFIASNVYRVNPDCAEWDYEIFHFIGRFLAKAIVDRQAIPAHFTKSFYEYVLNGFHEDTPISFSDYAYESPIDFASRKWLLDPARTQEEFVELGANFTVDSFSFGMHRSVELKPGGSDIPVTSTNAHEYVQLLVEYKMKTSIAPMMHSILSGFYSVIPFTEIHGNFSVRELTMMIAGESRIDVSDLMSNTVYYGYSESDSQIVEFWRSVKAMTGEQRAKLLQFVTGTSQVPLGGFGYLRQGNDGLSSKFSIQRTASSQSLPTARTCMNLLELPAYTSGEDLERKLLLAIEEGFKGFAFI